MSRFADDHWMIERFERDGYTYDGYIEDVMTAWDEADALARTQVAPDQEPTALADCIRYALIRTSLSSLINQYTPQQVVYALKTGLWTPERALAVIAKLPEMTKAKTYIELIEMTILPLGAVREQVEALALESALQVSDLEERVRLISKLVYWIEEEEREEPLERALDSVFAIEHDWKRQSALEFIASELTGTLRERGLEAAFVMAEQSSHISPLMRFAENFSEAEWERAFAIAPTLELEWDRAELLVALDDTYPLDAPRRQRILDAALAIEEEMSQAYALCILIRSIDEAQLERVLAAARTFKEQKEQSRVLDSLGLEMPRRGKRAEAVLEQWRDRALTIEGDQERESALSQLAQVRDKFDEFWLPRKPRALPMSAPPVKQPRVEPVLLEPPVVADEHRRAAVLAQLGQHLSEARQEALFERVRQMGMTVRRYQSTALAETSRQFNARREVDKAIAIEDEKLRANALGYLVKRINADGVERIFYHARQIRDLDARLAVYVRLIGFVDDARLLPLIRTTLLDSLKAHHTGKRDDLLWLLSLENLIAPPVVPITLVDRIADDVIDVCWNWRWQ